MTKTVDNFNKVAETLIDPNMKPSEFYFVQCLCRSKDGNPAIHGNNKKRVIKFFTVRSKEHLMELKPIITGICDATNARAYIHPTKRDDELVAGVAIETAVHCLTTKNFKGVKTAYTTACGQSFVPDDKKFIVDIDDTDKMTLTDMYDIEMAVNNCRGKLVNGQRVVSYIPTVSGMHLITWPFDVGQFKEKFPLIDVHKNNPTLLYYSQK